MVAIAVLLVYPLLGYAIAVGGAGLISPRCVVPVCCGFGLAAGILAARVFSGSARAGFAVVLLMVVWVGVREGICAGVLWEQRRAFLTLEERIAGERMEVDLILVADSSFSLPFHFYASRDVRRVVFFPIDFDAIHRYEPDDSGEQNLWAGRDGVFQMRITRFPPTKLGDNRLLIIGRPDGWLAKSVEAMGIELKSDGDDADWGRLGGVFTPMAHEDTRILVSPKSGQ